MYGNDDAPAAVIDTSFAPTYSPVPPGGRPPGRLGPYVGPATPQGPAPPSPGSVVSAESLKSLQNGALLAGGLAVMVGLGLFLANDHARVTAAREAPAPSPARPKRGSSGKGGKGGYRKNRGRSRDDEDDEDDEDDDDGT